jgi:hypothetical protein
VFSGPVPVLVPVLVDSLSELLKVLVEKLLRFRRCFWEIPEFDLDRIEGSDESRFRSRFGDFGHSTDSTVPEFLDLDRIVDSDESRFGDFGHSTDSTDPEFLDLDRVVDSDESRFGDFGHSPDPTDPGGFAENRPSGFRFDKFRILLGALSLPDCSPRDPLLASAAAGCAISGRRLA